MIEDWVFADFHEWLRYHVAGCNYYPAWRFETWPLPENLRHGMDRFLVMTADDDGRIHITQQRLWAGGVKRAMGGAA